MGPYHVAIVDGRETLLFSVQYLTANAIHLGFTVREVRLQPLQLRFNALMFSKLALVRLCQVFQRRCGHSKFLLDLVEAFLLLGCLGRYSLEISARVLFCGSQARGQSLQSLLGDSRFENPLISFAFQGRVGIKKSRPKLPDDAI